MLLFNWGGYHLLSGYFESRADASLQAALDKAQYNESDLLHIKVAASLPYGISSQQFERVNGNIDINGVTYAYVKRRFYRDTLEVFCLPHIQRTGIKNACNEFAKLANDFVTNNPSSGKASHSAHSAKFSVQDFTEDHCFFTCGLGQAGLSETWSSLVAVRLKPTYPGDLERPPQA